MKSCGTTPNPPLIGRRLSVISLFSLLAGLLILFGCAASSPAPPVMESYEGAVESLKSGDEAERLEAIIYLGASKNPAAIPEIAALLSDEDVWIRLETTLALRNFQSPLTIEYLRKALGDESAEVRFSAASALFELDDYSGEEALVEGLLSPRDDFRYQALMFLGRMRSRKALPGMIKLLPDPQPRLRATAAYLLGLYRERSAIPGLLVAMRDNVAYVRKDSWEALRAIAGRDYEFHWDGDEDLRNREQAVWQEWWEEEEKE